ncbi:SMI1/KNR4 family protein [Streptomyces sp. NPDC006197]|uniref:SMI1/KNR4 family protein n=1 Tax=Streptomyces sp. NPDC006197 TaxID=3156685 RepID=UPI0033BDAC16
MTMRDVVADLTALRIREYLADSPIGSSPLPSLRPPATPEQIAALAERAAQPLEPRYEEFLLLSDGMEGFYLNLSVLGCSDWFDRPSSRAGRALALLRVVDDAEFLQDVGLPASSSLFPVAVTPEGDQAIFLVDSKGAAPERFWWTGGGDSSFFGDFADLLRWATDNRSYEPRESVD